MYVFENEESVICTLVVSSLEFMPDMAWWIWMCIRMRTIGNDTNHEETNCEMDHAVSKPQ